MVTTKQEPASKYNTQIVNQNVELLARFINDNQPIVEGNNYRVSSKVPVNIGSRFPQAEFLGGKSLIHSPNTHWNGTGIANSSTFINSDDARYIFSLNTCSGCHAGETGTFFTHVKPTSFGTEAPLSGFLTGITVTDPASRPTGNPTKRTFNDLERRREDLDNFLVNNSGGCNVNPVLALRQALTFEPLRMTH